MFKLICKNKDGSVHHESEHETMELLNAFNASIEAKSRPWGKLPQRWIHEEDCSVDDIAEAIQSRVIVDAEATLLVPAHQVEEYDFDGNPTGNMIDVPEYPARPAVTHIEYELPAQYTIVIEDITAEYTEEQEVIAQEQLGKMVIDKCNKAHKVITGINTQKILSASLSSADIDQMEIDYAPVFDAFVKGRPDKATTLLTAIVPDGVRVTEADKARILSILA